MPTRFAPGTRAVVTGGAKGIGLAIAGTLAREGADLLLVGRDTTALQAAAQALAAQHGTAVAVVAADVATPAGAERIAQAVQDQCGGRVDIVVTAAGTRDHENQPVAQLDLARFEQVMQGNLMGTLLPIRALVPALQARGAGRVVALSGVYGLRGRARHAAGCSSKWAVEGLVRVLALELGAHGITVNAVCPGYVEGPRAEAGMAEAAARRGITPQALRQELEGATALGRLSTAQDVADAVAFLASSQARNITGQDLVVDGGWML